MHAAHGVLGARTAQLERLVAPGVSATSGVSLGGRSFGTPTASGRLRPPVSDLVRARGGAFRVTVPAASAAVLTFTGR